MTDLRAEVEKLAEPEREAWLGFLATDGRTERLGPTDRALCVYAEKLTRSPAEMNETDIAALRRAGLEDIEIHDAIQVVAYFNYINRLADAVHVDLEPEMSPYPEPDCATGAVGLRR